LSLASRGEKPGAPFNRMPEHIPPQALSGDGTPLAEGIAKDGTDEEDTMEELVKTVAQRAGIPEDKARMAVDVVVNQLKSKLPGPVSGQIDSALSGQGGGGLGEKLAGKLS
jgi:hypothetical protein